MSYGIQYRSLFRNELEQEVLILVARKDTVEADPIIDLTTVEGGPNLNDDSEEGTIIAREFVWTFEASENIEITWETFLASTYDEWWVIVYIDGNAVFEGFLTPEEGNSPFLDKPYDVTVRATNALKLLKNVSLSKLDDSNFKGKFTVIEYIVAALSKTQLNNISSPTGIPLRIYSSIYEPSMAYRAEDITSDWYQNIKLDHRTFMKDATTFVDCYETLLIILKRHSRLFYWNGRWVIKQLSEHQYAPAGIFYTEYNADGSVISGQEDLESYATVGKEELIYPINEDQLLSAEFAIKQAKTIYNYNIIPELPLNNKFDHGTHIDEGDAIDDSDIDGDGNTTEVIGRYHEYTIDDWFYGINTGGSANNALPVLNSAPELATFRKIYSVYNIELKRIVLLPKLSPTAGERWLQSDGIPVRADDKFNLNFDFRLSVDLGQFSARTAYIYVKGQGNIRWSLLWSESEGKKWFQTNGANINRGVVHNWQASDDSRKWVSFNIESPPIPITGTLYIVLANNVPGNNFIAYFTGFNFEYIPYVAGGYVPVKGEYVSHTQSANMIDVDTDEILIADSPLQVAKGAMFRFDGTPTTPNWFRHGVIEGKQFKELVNLRVFNFGYRRFYKLNGSFTSNEYEPENNQLNKQPLGYHKNYRMTDMSGEREFILNIPLQMNIGTGDIQSEFQEVVKTSDATTEVDTMEQLIQKIIGAVTNTTASEWDSAGMAPNPSDPWFPPTAGVYTLQPRSIIFSFTTKYNGVTNSPFSYNVDSNGAGNAPSLTQTFDSGVGAARRLVILQLGPDIAPGNQFTVSIFGHDVTVEVESISRPADGTQVGTVEFNYIF